MSEIWGDRNEGAAQSRLLVATALAIWEIKRGEAPEGRIEQERRDCVADRGDGRAENERMSTVTLRGVWV